MTAVLSQTQYETVVGLEVHVQLKTASKLFCACANHFGDKPNQNTCPVCLALPGVLPVLNEQALNFAVRLGLALNCQIATHSKFDRKQYFYPDLPKAYQISQFDRPVCENGYLMLSNGKKVRILRAHMEEDAGKLVHSGADGLAGSDYSLVDLNRAGTPLVEIVSMPDISSGEEAQEYMTQIRNIVRYLDVCDGNLEEGSMRCDANVSIRPVGQTELGVKTEVKNMNSFKAVRRAIESEVERQIQLVESGQRVVQESRLWNDATGTTITMRSKEEAHDYRYFPEPDLRPLTLDPAWVESIRKELPQLPAQRLEKLTQTFGLSEYDAGILVEFKELGDFFEATAALCQNYKAITNWLMGDITATLKNEKLTLDQTKLTPQALAELINLVDGATISNAIAKKILPELISAGGSPEALVKEKGMAQVSDEAAIRAIIQPVLDANPEQLTDYRAGKDKLFGFFVGQVMKASQGSVNPEMLNQILKAMLVGS